MECPEFTAGGGGFRGTTFTADQGGSSEGGPGYFLHHTGWIFATKTAQNKSNDHEDV